MIIGLMYYSRAGHTKAVVERIAERIQEGGHDVRIMQLELASAWSSAADRLPLKKLPEVISYDHLILGSPVHGGRLSAPMRTFMEDVPGLEGKRVVFLLTHFFRREWGAAQVIQQMTELSAAKGADVIGYGTVRWSGFGRGVRIRAAVDQIAGFFRS